MTSRRRRSRNKSGKAKQKRSVRRKTRKSKPLKRRSKIRTRVSLSKRRHSKKKRSKKIRVPKPFYKRVRIPKASYKREILQKPKIPIPQIHAPKLYISDIKGISKNYPEVLVVKGDYWHEEYISGLTFRELCIDYPRTTGVYPNHPYIQTHGAIYTYYNYGWAWGSAFSIQSKDRVAIYSNNYIASISLTTPLESGEGKLYQHEETPYKCVHYGKGAALIDIGNGNYYHISLHAGAAQLLQLGYQITHFFSDLDGHPCNVFWITSNGDLYIQYGLEYHRYWNTILLIEDPKISPPIRVPELQDPVSREQFFLKLLHMRQTQVSLFLRKLLDRTLVEHGILNEMPYPLRISPSIEDPLAL
jgi:hypothetical protein